MAKTFKQLREDCGVSCQMALLIGKPVRYKGSVWTVMGTSDTELELMDPQQPWNWIKVPFTSL